MRERKGEGGRGEKGGGREGRERKERGEWKEGGQLYLQVSVDHMLLMAILY